MKVEKIVESLTKPLLLEGVLIPLDQKLITSRGYKRVQSVLSPLGWCKE